MVTYLLERPESKIVLFYSGHGVNSGDSVFPSICGPQSKLIKILEVFDGVRGKKEIFTLSETCNGPSRALTDYESDDEKIRTLELNLFVLGKSYVKSEFSRELPCPTREDEMGRDQSLCLSF
jgi:hypothetical protein